MPVSRRYDRIIAISRSGATTEVLDLLGRVRGRIPTIAITADESSDVAGAADELITLGFADEKSVVQTRFATTTLALLRAALGHDLLALADDAEQALSRNLDPTLTEAAQITFSAGGGRWGWPMRPR